MKRLKQKYNRGSALVIALLLLTVLTIIGLSGMQTSVFELQMSGNTQDFYNSFQSADAGISAAMMLANDTNDPFDGSDHADAFSAFTGSAHPLYEVNNGPGAVAVDTDLILAEVECPRSEDASSADLLDCDYYRVNSIHGDANTGAGTRLHQGVGKELIDAGGG